MSNDSHLKDTYATSDPVDVAFPEFSVNCANCGIMLTGSFCTDCGQKDFNMRRPFWSLVEDAMEDLFSFDSRFFGTVFPLFFRPGYVTRQFNKGQRAKFVPPFRQYLVISIVFFLLLVNMDVQIIETSEDGKSIHFKDYTEAAKMLMPSKTSNAADEQRLEETHEDVAEDVVEESAKDIDQGTMAAIETDETITEEEEEEDFGDRVGNGVDKLVKDPQMLNRMIADWVPKMMFFMLPIFAAILKLTYIRRKKYYIEHLVYALHFHGFLFLLFTFMLLLWEFAPMSAPYLPYMLWYMPVYLLISLWMVYGQGPIKTLIKGLFVTSIYVIFISIGLFSAFVYGLTQV